MKQNVNVKLKEAVAGLGRAGEVYPVSFGYARNFLLSQGLATLVSGKTAVKAIKNQLEHKVTQTGQHQEVSEIAQSINGKSVTLKLVANEDGKLFASVQADDIALAFDVDPIFKIEPIKQIGEHRVTLDFGHDITANVMLKIESKGK